MAEDAPPARDLQGLFDPRSVAIVGASATPAKWGNWLSISALKGAHRRAVFLVNRSGGEMHGRRAYTSLGDLPQPVDLVVIAIAASGFEQVVDDALRAGAKAIVAITAGMAETGQAGLELERRVAHRVRAAGAVMVGPNCLGIADTGTELDLASHDFRPGPIGLVSQSGNLGLELALTAAQAGLGFSRFVSVGNQADLEVAELVRVLTSHEATRLIAVYSEDFRDGREFARAALHAHEAGKPVVLLTVGSSRAGARAARSHTGALVSDSVAVDAACRAGGIVRADTPRQLVDLAQGLLAPHLPRGRKVGIVGDGGGHVALAADLATAQRLELPVFSDSLAGRLGGSLPSNAATRNPVDLAGGGEQDFFNFARVVGEIARSGEVDTVLLTGFFGGYSQESEEFERTETTVAGEMAQAASAAGRSLVVQTMYPLAPPLAAMRRQGVPVYGDIGAATSMIGRVTTWRGRPPAGVPPLPPVGAGPPPGIGYFAAREQLAGAGIPFVEARRVTTLSEAKAAATQLGYPVVLKALGMSHKSDMGGVVLGLADSSELEAAFSELTSRLAPVAFSVERMAPGPDGVELLIGVRRDHSFGPIVAVALGGVFTELVQDVVVALAPVNQVEAETMIRSLRGAPLLLGARGRPPLDVTAAAGAAEMLSRLAVARPEIAEVEINPLLVLQHGVLALDARIAAEDAQLT